MKKLEKFKLIASMIEAKLEKGERLVFGVEHFFVKEIGMHYKAIQKYMLKVGHEYPSMFSEWIKAQYPLPIELQAYKHIQKQGERNIENDE